MRVHEILKSIRLDRGKTLEGVAADLELSYTTYQAYEQEQSKIQVQTLERIAKYYNISLIELISYRTQPEGTLIMEPFVPYMPGSNRGNGLKVMIELDGIDEHLNKWFEKLRKLNEALSV